MVEVIIKITGNTLLNEKVDELIKAARQIQETEENLDTKMEIKKKKENKKEPKKFKKGEVEEFEDVEEDIEEDIEEDVEEDIDTDEDYEDEDIDAEDDSPSIDELKKDAKTLFIRLTKKDKPKARKLLDKFEVDGFSDLEKIFKDDIVKWENLIKRLKKYVG